MLYNTRVKEEKIQTEKLSTSVHNTQTDDIVKVNASSNCLHPNTWSTSISTEEQLGKDKAIETDPPIGRHIQTVRVDSAHKKSGPGIICVSCSSQSDPSAEHIQCNLYTDLLTVCVANEHKINMLECKISSWHGWIPK